jgi:hypothetical protein
MTTKITITRDVGSGHDVKVVILGETHAGSHVEQSHQVLTVGEATEFYVHRYQSLSIEEVRS